MLCSSFCVNSTITCGIKHLEISFSSTFSFFFRKVVEFSTGVTFEVSFFYSFSESTVACGHPYCRSEYSQISGA